LRLTVHRRDRHLNDREPPIRVDVLRQLLSRASRCTPAILPGSGSSSPHKLTNVSGTLFFIANDGMTGRELWKSDGTDTSLLYEYETVASRRARRQLVQRDVQCIRKSGGDGKSR
jgi:hypothetical protein